jgi:UDP-GlcNAc:undecaprenyl-phosphate GlcNAc-1-phosphate transferase
MIIYLVAFILSTFVLFFIHWISQYLKLLDYPNKNRKLHLQPTPYSGGIAILIINILLIKITNFDIQIKNLIVLSSSIVLLGFLDDKYTLQVPLRVLSQIFCIFIITQQGFLITNLGKIFSNQEISLGTFSLLFTIICVAIIINGFNYLDGMDGLASSLFINSLLVTGVFLFLQQNFFQDIKEILIFISIPVITFFLFNIRFLKLPKLFLGDNGSLLIGIMLSFLLIYFSQIKKLIEPGLIIWIVALIFFDFFSTNFSRILKKKTIFAPGTDHLHFFLRKKIGLYKTLFLFNFFNIFIAFYGYAVWHFFGNLFSLINFIIFAIVYLILLNKINLKKNYFN